MCKKVIDEVGADGGLILAPNKMLSYPNDCKSENLEAICMLPINESIPSTRNYFYQSILNFVTIPMYSICGFVPNNLMSVFGGGYQRAILVDSVIYFVFIVIFTLIIRFYITRESSIEGEVKRS